MLLCNINNFTLHFSVLQRKRLTKCASKKTQTVDTQSPDDNEEVLEGMSSDSEGEITEEEPDDDDDLFQTETEEESEDSGDETSQLPNRYANSYSII